MSFVFTPDEIFALAEQIEENGALFYRKAAQSSACADSRELLTRLAEMEDNHGSLFSSLRKALPDKDREPAIFDPEGEAALYLKSLADSRVFTQPDGNPLAEDANTCSPDALGRILKFAVEREKDSIVFYLGMKELVGTEKAKCDIEGIIREEMQHIRLLNTQLAQIIK